MKKRALDYCLRVLKRHKQQIDAVVQIGIGWGREVSRLRAEFPRAMFVGFEPFSVFRNYWSTKGRYPGLVVPYAIADQPGVRSLYYPFRQMETTSFFPKDCNGRVETVEAITLNIVAAMWGQLGREILLWMDCEGAELEAVRGGQHFLRQVKWIVAEVDGGQDRQGSPAIGAVEDAILASGFSLVTSFAEHERLFVANRPSLPAHSNLG